HAAFLWIARGKLHDGKRQRKIKRAPGDQPDHYRAGSDGCGRGDPAQTDAGDDIEQHQVPKAHRAVRAIGSGRFTHGRESPRSLDPRRTSCAEIAPKSERDSWRGSERRAVETSSGEFLRSRFCFLIVA